MKHAKTNQQRLVDKADSYGWITENGNRIHDYARVRNFTKGAIWGQMNPAWQPTSELLPTNKEGKYEGRSVKVLGLTASGEWDIVVWDYSLECWVVCCWPGIKSICEKAFIKYWMVVQIPEELLKED